MSLHGTSLYWIGPAWRVCVPVCPQLSVLAFLSVARVMTHVQVQQVTLMFISLVKHGRISLS